MAPQVMELVELNSLRDAIVGMPGSSGLSVEQRKRLTIAVELVANPSIVFMDEPTSVVHEPSCRSCWARFNPDTSTRLSSMRVMPEWTSQPFSVAILCLLVATNM